MMKKPRSQPAEKRIYHYLKNLKPYPPHFILFEGGNAQKRQKIALFWASLLNCNASDSPCGKCKVCEKVKTKKHKEIFFIEAGQDSSIKIGDISNIKSFMSYQPEDCNYRVFIFSEAHRLTPSASNSMLKLLEEPLPFNLFVFLVPHRALLLPTIVSRSYVFTLAWESEVKTDDKTKEWAEELFRFWLTSKGLIEKLEKEKIDRALLHDLGLFLLKELIQFLRNKNSIFSELKTSLSLKNAFKIANLLTRSLEMANFNVNPLYVLQWLGFKGFLILRSNM